MKRLVAAAVLLCASSCGFSVPTPPTGPHLGGEPVPVPFPPPPAKPEIIPDVPKTMEKGSAVWVDGSWEWRGHRWTWTAGRWEAPLPDTYYALPTTVRMSDGSLVYFAGAWKSSLQDAARAAAKAHPAPSSTVPAGSAAPASGGAPGDGATPPVTAAPIGAEDAASRSASPPAAKPARSLEPAPAP